MAAWFCIKSLPVLGYIQNAVLTAAAQQDRKHLALGCVDVPVFLRGPQRATLVGVTDLSFSCLIYRAQGKLLIGKPVCLSQLDSLNSNSEDAGLAINTEPPPKEPSFSKLQDLAAPSGVGAPCLTPSPAPVLNVNSPSCFGDSALPYPRLSGLHRSMESLSLPMSVAPSDGYPGSQPQEEEKAPGGWPSSCKASLTVTERYIYHSKATDVG